MPPPWRECQVVPASYVPSGLGFNQLSNVSIVAAISAAGLGFQGGFCGGTAATRVMIPFAAQILVNSGVTYALGFYFNASVGGQSHFDSQMNRALQRLLRQVRAQLSRCRVD